MAPSQGRCCVLGLVVRVVWRALGRGSNYGKDPPLPPGGPVIGVSPGPAASVKGEGWTKNMSVGGQINDLQKMPHRVDPPPSFSESPRACAETAW